MEQKDELRRKAEALERMLERARMLVDGLADEKVRWTQTVADLERRVGLLPGDCLLSAGYISYMGPFLSKYREELVSTWAGAVEKEKIPKSTPYSFTEFLSDPAKVGLVIFPLYTASGKQFRGCFTKLATGNLKSFQEVFSLTESCMYAFHKNENAHINYPVEWMQITLFCNSEYDSKFSCCSSPWSFCHHLHNKQLNVKYRAHFKLFQSSFRKIHYLFYFEQICMLH